MTEAIEIHLWINQIIICVHLSKKKVRDVNLWTSSQSMQKSTTGTEGRFSGYFKFHAKEWSSDRSVKPAVSRYSIKGATGVSGLAKSQQSRMCTLNCMDEFDKGTPQIIKKKVWRIHEILSWTDIKLTMSWSVSTKKNMDKNLAALICKSFQ